MEKLGKKKKKEPMNETSVQSVVAKEGNGQSNGPVFVSL